MTHDRKRALSGPDNFKAWQVPAHSPVKPKAEGGFEDGVGPGTVPPRAPRLAGSTPAACHLFGVVA